MNGNRGRCKCASNRDGTDNEEMAVKYTLISFPARFSLSEKGERASIRVLLQRKVKKKGEQGRTRASAKLLKKTQRIWEASHKSTRHHFALPEEEEGRKKEEGVHNEDPALNFPAFLLPFSVHSFFRGFSLSRH